MKHASFERLETRCLLSGGSVASTGIILQERRDIQFTADLGTFVFPAPATNLHAVIHWGDGTKSKGVLKADGVVGIDEIKFEIDGTHTYTRAGTYAIKVKVFEPSLTPTKPVFVVARFNDTAIVARGNTVLTGSVSGTYLAAPTAADLGAEYIFKGAGTAGDLGAVSASGDLILPGFISSGKATGTLTLTRISTTAANAGSVTLQLTGPTEAGFGPIPSKLSYVITGGTGAFVGATGIGSISVTLGTGGAANTFTFDFTSLFPPTPTPTTTV